MMNLQTAFRAFLQSTCRPGSLLLLGASALLSCASLPAEPVERAYYIDARKALSAESRLGWTVDRVEIAEAAVQAEQSACRVHPSHRKALKLWVNERIAQDGGPSEPQYRAGRDIDELSGLIDLERTSALLDEVERHVPDDCPYWVTPSARFKGLHSTAERWILLAESVGGGSLSFIDGKVEAGGGGAARVFAGYGVSTHWSTAVGFESGGDATLQRQSDGDGSYDPRGAFRFGIPAFLRLTNIDRIYDLELAAVARLTDRRFTPWGARIALAGGVAGLRRIGFMPSIQLWLAYEVYPAQDQRAAEHVLRLGTRVGVDFHP